MGRLLFDNIKAHLLPEEVGEESYTIVYQTQNPDISGDYTWSGTIFFTNMRFLFVSERKDLVDAYAYGDITGVKNHSAFPAPKISVSLKGDQTIFIRAMNSAQTVGVLKRLKEKSGLD